jgi:hypothetical protein
MGVGSLLVPLVAPRVLRPFVPGRGRWGAALVATALGVAAVTTAADLLARRTARSDSLGGDRPDEAVRQGAWKESARKASARIASVGGVASLALGGVAVTTAWASKVTPDRLYESRYMWAIHVVHHSSEHYNLSTALRQPVAEPLGTFLPYSALCLLGVSPELLTTARGINLLWQYWIHTEAVDTMGPTEAVLNTPSHHRVHHGSNPQYLDRNHGSMLIVWDRVFGTFEPETEPVVYGLTKNLGSFNPAVIIGHEYAAIVRDVATAGSWRERLNYILRGPGWAVQHRDAMAAADVERSTSDAASARSAAS